MKKVGFYVCILSIALAVSFSSCAPSIRTSASWVNKEKIQPPYKSVFILVLTSNLQSKTILENDLATAATAKGLKAYKSVDVFGPVAGKEGLPIKETLMKKISDLGCETIFTVALVDKQSETRYVPGSSAMYSPYSYGGYGGMGMYGGFGGYYGYSTSIMYSPGYYTTDKIYFVEANLYDAKTEELLMTIQSKADNPSGIQKSSKEYTQTLIDEIESLKAAKK